MVKIMKLRKANHNGTPFFVQIVKPQASGKLQQI